MQTDKHMYIHAYIHTHIHDAVRYNRFPCHRPRHDDKSLRGGGGGGGGGGGRGGGGGVGGGGGGGDGRRHRARHRPPHPALHFGCECLRENKDQTARHPTQLAPQQGSIGAGCFEFTGRRLRELQSV